MDFNHRVVSFLVSTIAIWLSLSNGLESDIRCLKSIKESLEDPFNYLSSSWDFNNNTEGFICLFTGVDCWHPYENKVSNLRLSGMGLKGQFPRGIEHCAALTGLDLSSNNLFGPIPSDISQLLVYGTYLDLSNNTFSGEIPPDIGNLSYLNVLRLDDNSLTGQIPPAINEMKRIKTFNVANNGLSGQVPVFFLTNLSVPAESYAGNSGLCGGPLPPCKAPSTDHEDRVFFISGFAIGWTAFTGLVFALSLLYLPNNIPIPKFRTGRRNRKRYQVADQGNQNWPTAMNRNEDSKIFELEKLVTRIKFIELVNATDNFSDANIIGPGKTGLIYKASLQNGWLLAIKRFYGSKHCSEERFMSELSTLGRLSHSNVVPLLGFCYETKERLLVYKYMSNGKLYDWIHPQQGNPKMMEWPLRVKIAVGVAKGLAWLHHNRELQVFHHNISSKSILLDGNFEPKISNFGEAMVLNPDVNSSGGSFSINGEILWLDFGKEDVYSFGILLLELITGKEPNEAIDSSVSTSVSLVDWICNLSSGSFSLRDVADNSLIGIGFNDEISQLLNIARKCIQRFADERPTMLRVYQTMRAFGPEKGKGKQTDIVSASEPDVMY